MDWEVSGIEREGEDVKNRLEVIADGGEVIAGTSELIRSGMVLGAILVDMLEVE